jgi:hypothetical protein
MSPRAEGLLPAGRRPSDPLLQENLLDLYHTFNRQGRGFRRKIFFYNKQIMAPDPLPERERELSTPYSPLTTEGVFPCPQNPP